MFKLQEFAMPQADVCINQEMYFRLQGEGAFYDFEKGAVVFKEKGELSGNTYFNSFSSDKWYKYTVIDKVVARLFLQGAFEVSLVKCFLADEDIIDKTVKRAYFASDEKGTCVLRHDFSLDQFEGLYYIKLKALKDGSMFYGGDFSTEEEPANQVKIGAVICTYKREKFICKNLELFKSRFLLNPNSQLEGNLDLYVVDNAGTLDGKWFDHGQLHLIRNKNVGGAGGFTRGIIEILESREPYTHVLLMDDDALLDTNSLERTFNFLSFAKEQHRDLHVGGATLRLDKQNVQLESGAVWNNNLLFNLKAELDLTSVADILFNDLEESRSYNAWVFACMPLCTISPENLPLPLFVRGDDMEYGIRNSKKILAMNGICAWHAPLHNKYSPSMTYYTIRNQLVLNALYDKNFKAKAAVGMLARSLMRELLYCRYENIELIMKAYGDFMEGVDFFLHTDGEALHKEIMGFAPKFLDFNQLSRTPYPFMYAKLNLSLHQSDSRKWKRLLRRATLNGYLLPGFLYKKGGWDNYGVVELTSARAVNFFRRKEMLQVDLVSHRGYVTRMDRKKFFGTWARFFRLAASMRAGKYKKAVDSYLAGSGKISNMEFWKKYLGIGSEEEKPCSITSS